MDPRRGVSRRAIGLRQNLQIGVDQRLDLGRCFNVGAYHRHGVECVVDAGQIGGRDPVHTRVGVDAGLRNGGGGTVVLGGGPDGGQGVVDCVHQGLQLCHAVHAAAQDAGAVERAVDGGQVGCGDATHSRVAVGGQCWRGGTGAVVLCCAADGCQCCRLDCSRGCCQSLQFRQGVHAAAIVRCSGNGLDQAGEVDGRDAAHAQQLQLRQCGRSVPGCTAKHCVDRVGQSLHLCSGVHVGRGFCMHRIIDELQPSAAVYAFDVGIGIVKSGWRGHADGRAGVGGNFGKALYLRDRIGAVVDQCCHFVAKRSSDDGIACQARHRLGASGYFVFDCFAQRGAAAV